jgi:hypothetical protein
MDFSFDLILWTSILSIILGLYLLLLPINLILYAIYPPIMLKNMLFYNKSLELIEKNMMMINILFSEFM